MWSPKKLKIFVVDDEKFNLKLIQQTLKQSYHCKIYLFDRFEHCLNQLQSIRPDIILSDFKFANDKGFTGLDFLQMVKRIDPNLIVIMYSGHYENGLRRALKYNGALDFVQRDAKFFKRLKRTIDHSYLHLIRSKRNQRWITLFICLLILFCAFCLFKKKMNFFEFEPIKTIGAWSISIAFSAIILI